MQSSHRLSIFADYFQFIVMDIGSADDFSSMWTDAALERMVAVGDCAISLGTLRNVDVEVEIHIVDTLPSVSQHDYDHIAEGSFASPSGSIAVMGCTGFLDDAYQVALPPCTHRFLYLVRGISSITDEWSPANDLYILYIAPGEGRQPRLIKHWKAAKPPGSPD